MRVIIGTVVSIREFFMSNRLVELRQKIDEIDEALLNLVRRRLALSREIASVKAEGSPVYRPAREALLMHKLFLQIDDDIEKEVVIRLWRLLLASSVQSQKTTFKIISQQGLEKFTQQFSAHFLSYTFCHTGQELIDQLLKSDADVGFFPYADLTQIASYCGLKTGIYLNHKIHNVAIICKNIPEETGFDISVFKSSNVKEENIFEKPGFHAKTKFDELVYIGSWVNL